MAVMTEKLNRRAAAAVARATGFKSRAMRREGAQVTMEWVVVAAVVIILAVLLATVLRPAVQALIERLAEEVESIQVQI